MGNNSKQKSCNSKVKETKSVDNKELINVAKTILTEHKRAFEVLGND